MVQAAGRGPRLVQSWPAPLQNERLSLGPWGEEGVGWVAGGKQGWISFMWTATPVAEQAPSDRHLGRTTGRLREAWSWEEMWREGCRRKGRVKVE